MDEKLFVSNPYEHLFIYYLQGRVPQASLEKQAEFIGNWEEEGFSFLFFSAPADDAVAAITAPDNGPVFIDQYEMTCEQWHGDNIDSYTTGRFCVSPPWKIPFVNRPETKHLLLDPGVVFGTGRHQTTEDCLGYMEDLFDRETIDSVLDLGTGTGLLALGAAALGCRKVLALDFNLLAAKTALHNIRLNGHDEHIVAVQARAEEFIALPADLVVANIHYDVMKTLIETEAFLQKKWFILSGLLKSEAAKVLARLGAMEVTIVETACNDGVWHTILGRSNAPLAG